MQPHQVAASIPLDERGRQCTAVGSMVAVAWDEFSKIAAQRWSAQPVEWAKANVVIDCVDNSQGYASGPYSCAGVHE